MPDARLQSVCAPVTAFDAALRALTDNMLATMYDAPGRGLAAPQVGVLQRLFVMDATWKEGTPDPQVMVNPQIVEYADTTETAEEGCLSIPDTPCQVTRPIAIRVTWQDVTGAPQEGQFDGFAARCIQHEADHLDGILCTDRAI